MQPAFDTLLAQIRIVAADVVPTPQSAAALERAASRRRELRILHAYTKHARREFSDEMLMFAVEARAYATHFDTAAPYANFARAQRIVRTYVKRGAPREINLCHAVARRARRRVRTVLHWGLSGRDVQLAVFREAEMAVYADMLHGSWMGFAAGPAGRAVMRPQSAVLAPLLDPASAAKFNARRRASEATAPRPLVVDCAGEPPGARALARAARDAFADMGRAAPVCHIVQLLDAAEAVARGSDFAPAPSDVVRAVHRAHMAHGRAQAGTRRERRLYRQTYRVACSKWDTPIAWADGPLVPVHPKADDLARLAPSPRPSDADSDAGSDADALRQCRHADHDAVAGVVVSGARVTLDMSVFGPEDVLALARDLHVADNEPLLALLPPEAEMIGDEEVRRVVHIGTLLARAICVADRWAMCAAADTTAFSPEELALPLPPGYELLISPDTHGGRDSRG